ncbi:uncharacterized protein LOC135058947 isoform X1 [Pseudophryne corroboree]|uniref:uncharacterized protein LOC135058947 isoform X1 n=1 Tax=Pseudophryne corroboree TaxID=495146 RepID=UPI003081FD54
MASNRVYPAYQDYDTFSDSTDWDSRRSVAFQNEKDCNCCFQRRCFCITGIVLLTLGAISAFISLGVIYGIPENKVDDEGAATGARSCCTAVRDLSTCTHVSAKRHPANPASSVMIEPHALGHQHCVTGRWIVAMERMNLEDTVATYPIAFQKAWYTSVQTVDRGHTWTNFVTTGMTVGTVQMNQPHAALYVQDGDATLCTLQTVTASQRAAAMITSRTAQTGVMRYPASETAYHSMKWKCYIRKEVYAETFLEQEFLHLLYGFTIGKEISTFTQQSTNYNIRKGLLFLPIRWKCLHSRYFFTLTIFVFILY